MNHQFPDVPEKLQAYQWMDGEAHMVGTKATDRAGRFITDRCPEVFDDERKPVMHNLFLMRWAHTGELEWVEAARLSPYPSSPIPEPTK